MGVRVKITKKMRVTQESREQKGGSKDEKDMRRVEGDACTLQSM